MLHILYASTIIVGLFSKDRAITVRVRKKHKLKICDFYWILTAVVMCLLSVTTTTYTDVDIYTDIFNWTNIKGMTIDTVGWGILCKLFYAAGVNYRGMIVIVLITSCYIMHRGLQRIDVNEAFVMALMLVMPGAMQVIQIKFFLATSIILYTLSFILGTCAKKDVVKFSIGIVVATLIHSASIICFVYLAVLFFEKIDTSKSILYSMAALIGIVALYKVIPLVAGRFLNPHTFNRYFSGVEIASVNWVIIVFLSWLLVTITTWLMYKAGGFRSYNGKPAYKLIFSRGFTCICLSIIVIPLLLFDQNFYRLLEVTYIIAYILFAIYYKTTTNKSKYFLSIVMMIAVLFSFRYFVIVERILPLFNFDGFVSLLK